MRHQQTCKVIEYDYFFAYLRTYSKVNQVMQMASIMEMVGLSVGWPLLSGGPWRAGSVPITIAIVEITTKRTDTKPIT